MNLLIVTTIYPPKVGGPSLQIHQIVQNLKARNINVSVCLLDDPCEQYKVKEVNYYNLNKNVSKHILIRRLQYFKKISKIIKANKIDLIHIQTFAGPLTNITVIVGSLYDTPTLLKITGERTKETLSEKLIDKKTITYKIISKCSFLMDIFILKIVSMLWVTSPEYERILINKYKVHSSKITVLPNFLDLDPFLKVNNIKSVTQDKIKILTVTRLRPWKGIELSLQILKNLHDLNVCWSFVGDGSSEYVQKLKDLAEQYKVQNKVKWLGEITSNELPSIYGKANIFVLLSREEPFGIVLTEAMATGLPVVATNVGGIPFVLKNYKQKKIVEYGNIESTVESILDATKISAEVSYCKRQSSVRMFTLSEGINKLFMLYCKMTNKSNNDKII